MAEHLDMEFESLLRRTLEAEAASMPVSIGPAEVLRRRELRRRHFGWLTDPRRRSRDRDLRLATVFGVLAVAALVGFAAVLSGQPAVIPGASPSPSPSPSLRAIPDTGGNMQLELEPGAWYADHGFPFRIELSLPELPSGRWAGQSIRPPLTGQPAISIHRELPVGGSVAGAGPGAEVDIAVVDHVYADPCASDESARRRIGSADDLLAWLARLPGGAGSQRTTVAVGDLRGEQVSGLIGTCSQTAGSRTYALLADGLWLAPHAPSTISVVEVNGSIVAIRMMVAPGHEDVEQPAIAAVTSSIRFGLSLEVGPAPTPESPWPGRTLEPGVTPRHSPEEVEAKVMTVIQFSEQILGRLAEPRVRVTLLPPDSIYLIYRTDGSPAGGIGSGDALVWVAEFQGTYAHAGVRGEALACTAGILAYTDHSLALRSSGCLDANPRRLESPPPSIRQVNP